MNPLLKHITLTSASALTTAKIGGAVWTLRPSSAGELAFFVSELERAGVKYMPVGGGSNLIVSDRPKTVAVSTSAFNLVEASGRKIYAGAGARLSEIMRVAEKNGLSGVEFWAGIPATFGGAVKMNAGAFSSETMDKVIYIDVLTGGKVKRLWKGGINYGYRHTDIDGIILGGAIALEPSSTDTIRQKTREYLEKRRQTQPAGKSAGSVFKKAGGVGAGKYLDLAGLKGKRFGGAVVSEKHAGFFLNDGGATFEDFRRLADYAADKVWQKFGVKLEKEVVYFE
ncbi:MAG TPA: UDP-N-acetylenolpyruvoylglucosamine reductase [Clostridiales bacterium]|nr:UDP-N-acetylenolpyruvoylglucosamine reductase [Clostridiales bacterium]